MLILVLNVKILTVYLSLKSELGVKDSKLDQD